MNSSKYAKCHGIIHPASAAAAAVGGGLAQIPCSDSAVIVPIQIGMVIALGQVFDVSMTESSARAALATVATASLGRAVSQVLIGWMPGVGNAANAATAAAITETAGWLIAHDLDRETSRENAA